jgi:hypothetical protein
LSPLQHFWSLAVEEHFYFVIPSLLLVVTKLRGLAFFGRKVRWDRRAIFVIFTITILSFLYSIYDTPRNPTIAYFSTLSRAWELGAGSLLALATVRTTRSISKNTSQGLSLFGLALVFLSAFTFTESTSFPGFAAILPVCGSILIIFSGGDSRSLVTTVLEHRALQLVGRVSYSVYLWHWPLIIASNALIPSFAGSLFGKALLLFSTFVISLVTYKYVEQPFRRINFPLKWERGKAVDFSGAKYQNIDLRGPFLVKIISCILLSALILSNLSQLRTFFGSSAVETTSQSQAMEAGGQNPSSTKPDATVSTSKPNTITKSPLKKSETRGGIKANDLYKEKLTAWQGEIKSGINLKSVPLNLEPSLEDLEKPSEYWQNCFARSLEIACSYGNPNSPRVAVVFGDSYAIAIIPMLLSALELSEWKVISLTYGQCMVSDVVPLSADNSVITGCPPYRKWAIKYN